MDTKTLNLSELRDRTLVICSTWIVRNRILDELVCAGYSPCGYEWTFRIAPNIDIIPVSREFQTVTSSSYLIKKAQEKKYKIQIVEI